MNSGHFAGSVINRPVCATSLKTFHISSQCYIDIRGVASVLCEFPNLEIVQVHHITPSTISGFKRLRGIKLRNLQSLTLKAGASGKFPERILDLGSLRALMPNICDLTIQNWLVAHDAQGPEPSFAAMHRLQSLDISGVDLIFPLKLPPTIHTLNMSKSVIRSRSIEWQASQLVRLSAAGVSGLDFLHFQEMLEPNKGNLIYLDASSCSFGRHECKMLAEQYYLTKVEDLRLKNNDVDDEVAIAISKYMPALKRLSLANTRVSGVGVKAIVTALEGSIDYINLDNCNNTAYDAVEWARSKGVNVAFASSDGFGGGKRIRER